MARASAAGGPPVGLTWRGPACPPVTYPAPHPELRVRRWRRGRTRTFAGELQPDARVGLLTGDSCLTCWLEYERGPRRVVRRTAMLRHIVGWGAAAYTRGARLLVILPASPQVDREAVVHRLVEVLVMRATRARRC